MIEIVKYCLEFIIVFLVVYLFYYFFEFKKLKKYNREKAPVNIKYMVYMYNLDVVKIGYKKVAKSLNICDALIVALLFTVTDYIDNTYIRLIVIFILIFPSFAFSYHLIAKYYKKESE